MFIFGVGGKQYDVGVVISLFTIATRILLETMFD